MGILKKVYGYISDEQFFAMIDEARRQKMFVSPLGKVDIGALIEELIASFGQRRYQILPKETHKEEKKHPTGVDDLAETKKESEFVGGIVVPGPIPPIIGEPGGELIIPAPKRSHHKKKTDA